MIIVTTASKAKNIFAKYDTNIAAFTAGKTKGIDDAELQVSLTKLNILPDEDDQWCSGWQPEGEEGY